MTTIGEIKIPLSKSKLLLMLGGSVAFVALGIWFVIEPKEISRQGISANPMLIFIVGIASILFFGLCAMFTAKKIMDNRPGLIINSDGIVDNSGATSVGLILWKDIKGIKETAVANQKFITVVVNNPEEYINDQNGFIKRKAMELNFRNYHSPINISTNGLKCNFNELYQILIDEFDKTKA